MAIPRAQLLREMSTELTSLFGKAYTEEKINKKKKTEEKTGMLFKYLVTRNNDGTIDVDDIPSDTAISRIDSIKYTEETLPKEIGDKMKMLMWTPEETNNGLDEIGIRVGERMFWIA
jgi:hypothetical protein